MQRAEHVFEALHKLGQTDAPVTRIYRQLFNRNMYLGAYAKIYSNRGSLDLWKRRHNGRWNEHETYRSNH